MASQTARTLRPEAEVAHCRIVSPLGAGGMQPPAPGRHQDPAARARAGRGPDPPVSAKDLALQLREIVEEWDSLPASGSSVASGPAAAPATRTRPLVLVAAGAGILAVLAALGPAGPVTGPPAWSPDGRTIATLSPAPPPGLGSKILSFDAATGTGRKQVTSGGGELIRHVSPDSRRLVVSAGTESRDAVLIRGFR